MAIQSYEPNLGNMQEYLQKEQENQGSITWWSIPSGMSSVRILPPWDPTGRVALPVYMHPIEFQGRNMSYKKYNWTCNRRTSGKPCQICEGLEKLKAVGVDVSDYEANRRQFYFNAIVMSDPTYNQMKNQGTPPGTFVLMRTPKTFYDWVVSQITNPLVGDITNLQTGIDIYVTKEGTGLGTSYSMTLSPNGRTPVPKEYLDKIESLYNLDEIFSTGFDQEQIDEMMQSLNSSVAYLSQNIPGVMNQMGGWQGNGNQPPVPINGLVNKQGSVVSAPWEGSTVNPIPAAPPSQYSNPQMNQSSTINPPLQQDVVTPYIGVQNLTTPLDTSTRAQSSEKSNIPKCHGSYNPSSVNCVTCPYELDCSKVTNG